MYCLTDQQIEYILRDIRARGVEMEELQNDILDHVCCIIEQQLEANGDFERFYEQTIRGFYTHHLWEIEEETITLQLFKHYYAMKKTMIASGVVSAITIVVGALFKINHWPGANVSLTLGLGVLSLLFLPLLFILRIREKNRTRDKAILVFGLITGMMAGVGALFKLLHWPFGDLIKDVTLYTLMLGFVPVYFFTGIRQPENRVNTIVTSILLLITGGMLLTMTSVGPSRASNEAAVETIADNERLVAQLEAAHHAPSVSTAAALNLCSKLKTRLTQAYTGYSKADGLSTDTPVKLNDASAYHMLRNDDGSALTELQQLHQNLVRYKPASSLSLVKDLDQLSADDWYNAHFFNCNYSDALVKLTQVQVMLLTQP